MPSFCRKSVLGLATLATATMTCFFLFLTGCTRKPPLRIGIGIWPGYEFLYLAQEKDFFKEEGADVEIVELQSPTDIRHAFEEGHIDIMATTVVEVLVVRDQTKLKPVIFTVLDYSSGADVVLGQSPIRGLAQLKGKKVAIEAGSLNGYLLSEGLKQNGLKLTDVTLVNENQVAMVKSFEDRKVDAVVTFPPFSSNLLKSGKAKILFSSKAIPMKIVDVLSIDQSKIQSRGADLAAVSRAFSKAQDYAKNHPDGYALMAAREGVAAREFIETLKSDITMVGRQNIGNAFVPGGLIEGVIAEVGKTLVETKEITKTCDPKQVYLQQDLSDAKP